MPDDRLDDVHIVETPEGVRLLLRPAGPPVRMLAYMVDSMLRGAVYVTVLIGFAFLGPEFAVSGLILTMFAGEWLYPVCFEVLSAGQTPGKRALGIRVVQDDGTPIGWSASLLRNLLLAADFLPGSYGCGLVSMLSTRGFRRLGDLAAGTLVVHAEPRPSAAAQWPQVDPAAPSLALGPEEQRAVISFAERTSTLSEERAEELASVAAPLLVPGEPAARRLHAVASWLLGREGEPR